MTKKNTKLDNDFKKMNQNINLICPFLSLKVFWKSLRNGQLSIQILLTKQLNNQLIMIQHFIHD